jgi:hypothetical protein
MRPAIISSCLIALAVATAGQAAEKPVKPRIVACDDAVRSAKRGVCANHLDAKDFTVFAPGVSWFYNWFHTTNDVAPAALNFEFIPMMWGNDPARLTGLKAYLAAGHKPRAVLAINEPNLKGQAFITPEVCADLYRRTREIADAYGIPTVGPHMAIGSSAGDSITAMDPIEKKNLTYTFMMPYLKAFMHYRGANDLPGIGVHAYGDINELRWVVDATYKEFGKPVWMTEYAWWGAKSDKAALDYLVQATDFLEHNPKVAGYAWFKERSDNARISLLASKPGELTPLGRAYVDMPVHDADLFYRVPGRLQAERYVDITDMETRPTDDTDGFLHMRAGKAGAELACNIAPDKAGDYSLALRATGGAGTIAIQINERKVGSVAVTNDGWQTVSTKLRLAAGPQTIRLVMSAKGQTVNWIEFGR